MKTHCTALAILVPALLCYTAAAQHSPMYDVITSRLKLIEQTLLDDQAQGEPPAAGRGGTTASDDKSELSMAAPKPPQGIEHLYDPLTEDSVPTQSLAHVYDKFTSEPKVQELATSSDPLCGGQTQFVAKCDACVSSSQCISGYCCPFMKKCIQSGDRCPAGTTGWGECRPRCSKVDCPSCTNPKYPSQWVTCPATVGGPSSSAANPFEAPVPQVPSCASFSKGRYTGGVRTKEQCRKACSTCEGARQEEFKSCSLTSEDGSEGVSPRPIKELDGFECSCLMATNSYRHICKDQACSALGLQPVVIATALLALAVAFLQDQLA